MQATRGYLLCLAYILGLLLAGVQRHWFHLPLGAIALGLGTITSTLLLPRLWRGGPNARFWVLAGLISSVAFLHIQIRTPQPGDTDISRWYQRNTPSATITTVQGKVLNAPKLTRSHQVRFVLEVHQAIAHQENGQFTPLEPVTGKAYTTVTLLQGTGLYPGQSIQVTGTLYAPSPAKNPGGFDFRAYLKQEGIFMGLRGQQVRSLDVDGRSPPILWRMRQRIVKAIVERLGTPSGTLLSAMVLGRSAVDLPHDIRDEFTQAGLAHTIAASGFHVSLLLGVVMVLSQHLAARTQCITGSIVLLVYVGLTGVQASVIRAGLMGFGALLGKALERKTKPVGGLLLVAVIMLIANPLWVWNLGFQLSFLATLGLLVLAPALMQRLDWMPTGIATLIAIPIAAYLWTLPIQLAAFGTVPTYSVVLNVLATPLIVVISLGGMVGAAIALLVPFLGGWVAWCLQLPIRLLIWGVEFWNELPGNTLTTGHISVLQIIAIYGVYVLVWWKPWWQKRWWLSGLLAIALITLPLAYTLKQLQQVTVLATSHAPAIVVQNRGQAGLIFSGTDNDANFTVLPFLRSQGIRKLQWAIALSPSHHNSGWPRITDTLPIQALYYPPSQVPPSSQAKTSLVSANDFILWRPHLHHSIPWEPGSPVQIGSHAMQFVVETPAILRFSFGGQIWMVCDRPWEETPTPAPTFDEGVADVIWWSGQEVDRQWMYALKPNVAIAPSLNISNTDLDSPIDSPIQQYYTHQDGALQWTPQTGFIPYISAP